MTGKKIGYIRVSIFEQNPDRQLKGLTLDKKFIDKASGRDTKRPELEALMNYVREDDIVIVHSMDRLARNLDDLRQIVHKLNKQKVQIQFIKENLTFIGEDSAMSNLLLSVMGAFVEFERALIRERQKEGIAIAKTKGVYKGRKVTLNDLQIKSLQNQLLLGISKAQVARNLNISRQTLYNYLANRAIV